MSMINCSALPYCLRFCVPTVYAFASISNKIEWGTNFSISGVCLQELN